MSTTKADATPSSADRTSAPSAAPAAAAPIGLVQQLGNQGLQTLLRARLMQAKLTVSYPQDAYEQEADRVADQVMRMPSPIASSPVGAIQRLPEPRALHRSAGPAADVPNVDATTEHGIQSLSGRGSALPASLRSFMEPRFNADFGAVRVHTDSHAHHLARAVNAHAFTIGPNVVFGAGRYAPETESGKRLIAHELTHVVQQSPASVTGPSRIQRQPASAETGAAPPQIEGAAKKIGFVRFHSGEQYLNLYSAPDELSKVVDVLEFGQRVHRVEGSNSAPDSARAGEAVARRPDRATRWLKVVVLGQTGYVDESRIHFPPPDLIQKDPGLRLIRVRPGLTFYGLVHEMYGIKGDESTKDLNMNHFINAIRSVNKKGAFDVKTDALDRAGNFLLSGRDAKNTYLKANYDLWIPSIGVAAKMDVGSGTIRGELVRIEKKIEQILQDFKDAALMSGDYIWDAVKSRAGDVGMGLISGLVDFAKDALTIMAAATAAGAVIGAILGAGAGAVPGMEIGFEIGLLILDIYGVYFLVETVLSMAGALVSQLGRFIALVWEAKGDKKQLDLAARALADALGILASAMLVAIAAYVLKKGGDALLKTKFAQTVGRTRLGEWIKDRQRLKTTDERVSAAAEKARENTRAREAERARDAAPPGMTWVKTGDGVEVLVPKSSPRSSRGTKVDPARFKKEFSVSTPKRPTVIDLEVDGNAARVPGGSPKRGALQVVPRTSPPAARANVGSFNPARNATVGAGLERTRSGAVAEAGNAIDETGQMTARGNVITASVPGAPRHIPPTLPTPAAPGTFVPAEPRFLPPDRQIGGLGRDTKFVLPDPRVTEVAGLGREGRASVPLSEIPDVPPPERSRRVGGFGRQSEPPVPHNPTVPPSTSPPVAGFRRDPQRLQGGAGEPEVPVEKLRRVGGFGRRGEPAVPHDPSEPRFLRDPKENQPVQVDGFARGRGVPVPADEPDFVIDLQAHRLGPDTAHGEFDGKDPGPGPAPDQQTIIVDDSLHRDGSNGADGRLSDPHVFELREKGGSGRAAEGAGDSRTQRRAMGPVDGQAPRTGTDLTMLNRARSSIREKLFDMLRTKKVVERFFTVEQVQFGALSVKLVKDVLIVSIFDIRKDPSAPRGHGSLIMQEFERAAMDVGRAVGARRVRREAPHVVNSVWAEDLRKRGYRPLGGDEKTKGGSTSQAGEDLKLAGDKKTKVESTPQRLVLEIELSGSSGRTPKGPPSSTANTAPKVSEQTPGAQGSGGVSSAEPRPSILVVGAETADEFSYARAVARRGAQVVVVNPIATAEASTFQQAGGTFVQARIEDLPETARFDLIREDYPVPVEEFWAAKNFATPRLKRLDSNGFWIVVTESKGFVEALESVGRILKVNVTVHETTREHEASPVSSHPQERGRYVVTVTRRPKPPSGTSGSKDFVEVLEAGGKFFDVSYHPQGSGRDVVTVTRRPKPPSGTSGSSDSGPGPVRATHAESAPAEPARADFGDDIPSREIKPRSETAFLQNIVAQARKRLSDVLGKLDDRHGVAPGEEHLSPECMSGHCGLSRRIVARALKQAGLPEGRIFMNEASAIAGTGAHTFTVLEIAPGRYILIDATFAQFTGMLEGAPRVGEMILRRSGQVGVRIRNELLEKGFLVLNDEIADIYVKVVSESERGAYTVRDLVREQASLDRNLELLLGL